MSLSRILIFLAVFTCLVSGLHYYVWARMVRDPALPAGWTRGLTFALALLALTLPVSFALSRTSAGAALRPLYWLVYVWMGAGFLLATWLFAADLLKLAVSLAAWGAAKVAGSETPDNPARRLLLARAIAATVGASVAGMSALGMRSALAGIELRELDIKVRNLPAALAGMKIVQISDVHIGPLLHHDWLAGIVARIGKLQPDLIAITGDLVDGSVADLRRHVAPLAELKAPRGVFFVTGNHEYYSGVEEWTAHLPTLGVQPLRNRRVEVAPGLDLAGIDDLTGRPDLQRALAGRDPQRPLILLAHQPKQFLEAAEHGVDLTLSGHTHGGQIWPFVSLVRLVQPYVAGLHSLGAAQLYVSRGTGFWGPPMRVLAPPEITLLRLHPA